MLTERNLPAYRAVLTAAALRSLGCLVLGCHAINGRPWVKARLPAVDARERHRIIAYAWQYPAMIEWRSP